MRTIHIAGPNGMSFADIIGKTLGCTDNLIQSIKRLQVDS